METPYQGRAILNESFNELEIVIPTIKNWFVLMFLGFWLAGWTMGELFAIGSVFGLIGDGLGFANLFLLFWLCGWTVAGFFAFKFFFWMLKGKEVITIGQGQLTIKKIGSLLSKPKTYDLKEVKKLRVKEPENMNYGFFGGGNNINQLNSSNGTIRFDYGMKTVMFAIAIDSAEADFIINKLTSKRLLSEENL